MPKNNRLDMNDLIKDKRIRVALAVLAAMSGIIAIVTYLETKKTRKLREEVMTLDKEIKALELANKLEHTKFLSK